MVKLVRPIGDLDLHLFGEGTHRRLWELLGPQPLHVDDLGCIVGARFAVWAPEATAVGVVGDWNEWQAEPMAPVDVSGIWTSVIPLARSGHHYGFEVTHVDRPVERVADPAARESASGFERFSIVPTSDGHVWGDDAWLDSRGVAAQAATRRHRVDLDELHAQGVRTWDDVSAHVVDEVIAHGCTHVELAPVTQGPASRTHGPASSMSSACWSGRFATAAQFGDPDGFRRLVDDLHQRNVGVLVVWSLSRSRCSADDLLRREVRSLLIANALYWLDEFHVDGLHLDDCTVQSPQLAELADVAVAVVSEEFPDALLVVD